MTAWLAVAWGFPLCCLPMSDGASRRAPANEAQAAAATPHRQHHHLNLNTASAPSASARLTASESCGQDCGASQRDNVSVVTGNGLTDFQRTLFIAAIAFGEHDALPRSVTAPAPESPPGHIPLFSERSLALRI